MRLVLATIVVPRQPYQGLDSVKNSKNYFERIFSQNNLEHNHLNCLGQTHSSSVLPQCWSCLPALALPDGAHQHNEDSSYFLLPSKDESNKTVFGISCYRQIETKKLKVKDKERVIFWVIFSLIQFCPSLNLEYKLKTKTVSNIFHLLSFERLIKRRVNPLITFVY